MRTDFLGNNHFTYGFFTVVFSQRIGPDARFSERVKSGGV